MPSVIDDQSSVTIRMYAYDAQNGNKTLTIDNLSVLATDLTTSKRSADIQNFYKIAMQTAEGDVVSYYAFDATSVSGTSYYRIKAINARGTFKCSNIGVGAKTEVTGYPNPLPGNTLNLQFANLNKGKYLAELFNVTGQKIVSQVIEHAGGSSTQEISFDKK